MQLPSAGSYQVGAREDCNIAKFLRIDNVVTFLYPTKVTSTHTVRNAEGGVPYTLVYVTFK